MKLKLTQPGYETLTGLFGYTEFKDGLSVSDVAVPDAMRLAAILQVEWEDGTNPSAGQAYEDRKSAPAPVVDDMPRLDQDDAPQSPEPEAQLPRYTKTALEVIADQHGIKGLREIADPLGVTANSIAGLIDKLVDGGFAKAE